MTDEPSPPPPASETPEEKATLLRATISPNISLGHEGDMRVTPHATIPAPDAEHASAVAPYSTPLRFDWRTPKPGGGRQP